MKRTTAIATIGALVASALAVAVPTAATAAAAPAAAVDGTPVGSGSFAPEPPASLPSYEDVRKTLDQPRYIDTSKADEPVPTNQWWTDLVVSRFSGDLWSYPFVASNSTEGTRLSYPTSWNADGTAMTLEDPIVVSGTVEAQPDPSDLLLADFDTEIPSDWTATGDAFDDITVGTPAGQSQVSGWTGAGYLNSFTEESGDGATGTLTSAPFTVDRAALAFQIAGGEHPGQEEIRLLIDGEPVLTATGRNSEQFEWVSWDLSPFAGRTAQLEVVDTLTAGWAHIMIDHVLLTDRPDGIADRFSTAFRPDRADALRWGDWNVSWRMPQAGAESRHIDVTALRGAPYQWFEFSDVSPRITVQPDAAVVDGDGEPVTFPVTTDRLQIVQNGHVFGIHAPEGTGFTRSGATIQASAGTAHLVVSAVPASGLTLDKLHETAFAIPRDSRMSYDYDPAEGVVNQQWDITTEALEGTNLDTVQGWLQHQYAEADNDLSFTGATYQTPRGLMKTTRGHGGWTLRYAFTGLSPIGAQPVAEEGENAPYDSAVMRQYVRDYAAKTTYGGDTYWGGKDLLQLGEYMLIARQIGETDAAATLQSTLETALTDWYTYTEGETEHFFARYPTWKALVGFGDSYGSAQFNDHHFHYGYFTSASAMLAMVDPDWASEYGGMATLVAKEYANDDREDADYPYLRTFGIWDGRSSAGGFSSPGGNNQESSSEAIQSEAGLFLLGTALGDAEMQATGAMQYVTERATVRAYYQNVRGNPASSHFDGNGAFPASYDHDQVGIMFDSGQAYATYFSGDPAWIYGIQWMPTAPWFNFFGWDPAFSSSIMQTMMDRRPENVGTGETIGAAAGRVQMLTKRWYGIGSYGDIQITRDRPAAVEELKSMVVAAEKHHPGYVFQRTAENPLYDAASGTLYVTPDGAGGVTFPAEHWTPETLPASLVPAERSGEEADRDPATWQPTSPLLAFFATQYTVDAEAAGALYGAHLDGYQPESDRDQAVSVFSKMGDALGNVVLGFLAQYDPDTYADIHSALWEAGDPVAKGVSMAGIVYHQAMSNRTVGTEVTTRHTSSPLSQVYRDDDGVYSYVVFNPSDAQETYQVYEGEAVIGEISVPAHTQITSRLDAGLDRIEVGSPDGARTIVPGSEATFTATGYDQYGATFPLEGLTWTASAGSITTEGTFSSAQAAEEVRVTAAVGDVSGSATVRVDAAPALSSLSVAPGFARVVVGIPTTFTAEGRDQYGDPFPLSDPPAWSYTGAGTIADGVLTATSAGSGHVVATSSGVSGSAVIGALTEIPLVEAAATASSQLGGNVAELAVDADTSTRWESEHGVDGVDLTLDLGAATDIERVDAVWEAAAARSYTLQVADSLSGPWRDVRTVEKTDAGEDSVAVGETARYVRLHMTSRLTAYGYSLWEVRVHGTPAATAITPATVLLNPRSELVRPGSQTAVQAYAFAADGAGGPVEAEWSTDGGSVSPGGVFTAPAQAGVTATVEATVGAARGTATFTTGVPSAAERAPR